MASEQTETPTGAIKSFISTIWPFVGFAFALIQYIYTTQSADKQSAIVDIKAEQEVSKKERAELRVITTLQTEQIKNNSEKIGANAKAVEALTNRQNDLEKTVILSNVGRR